MQPLKDLLKKAETASNQLKKINTLIEQWSASMAGIAALTVELSDEISEFSSDDAYATMIAGKFKEAALIFSHQSNIMLKGADHGFLAPVQEIVAIHNTNAGKKGKWWAKSDEEVKHGRVIEDWYNSRHECFRIPFANLIGFQTLFYQNISAVWNGLITLVEDKQIVGLTESSAKGVLSTVDTLVANPLSLQYFRKFLDQDHAVENLNFILDVNAFMIRHRDNRTSFEDFRNHAVKVFDRYISQSSEQQVNLDYENVDNVKRRMANIMNNNERDEQVFAESRRSIMALLTSGPLPRFRTSPLCQEMYMTWRPSRAPTDDILRAASPAAPIPPKSPNSGHRPSFLSFMAPAFASNNSTPSSTPPISLPAPPSPPSSSPLVVPDPSSWVAPPTPISPPVSPPVSPPLQRRNSKKDTAPVPDEASQASTTPRLSSQHRVRLEKGPNDETTPVFFKSRSTSIAVPKKTVTGVLGTSVGAPAPVTPLSSSASTSRVDDYGKTKQRRPTVAEEPLHSQFSFQAIEKYFLTDPQIDENIFVPVPESVKHKSGLPNTIGPATGRGYLYEDDAIRPRAPSRTFSVDSLNLEFERQRWLASSSSSVEESKNAPTTSSSGAASRSSSSESISQDGSEENIDQPTSEQPNQLPPPPPFLPPPPELSKSDFPPPPELPEQPETNQSIPVGN